MEGCGEGVSTTASKLAELFGVVPDVLVDYFENSEWRASCRGQYEVEVHPLTLDEALVVTKDFRCFHPVISALGGVILDDANTSNHHVYLSSKPCDGTVLYLDHDGVTRIVFPTLAAFVEASRNAIATGQPLTSEHSKTVVVIADQTSLSQFVDELFDGRNDGANHAVILALIPSLDLRDQSLFRRLTVDSDFYFAEAIGDTIAQRPHPSLIALAELCQQHPHSQASRAGVRALAAIRAISNSDRSS